MDPAASQKPEMLEYFGLLCNSKLIRPAERGGIIVNMKELTYKSPIELKTKFIDAYLRIWNDKKNLPFLSFTGIAFSRTQVEAWVLSLEGTSPIQYLYVEDKDQIIGVAVIQIDPLSGIEILGLGIDEGSKRKGVATYLLNEITDISRNNGFKSIDAKVFSDNKPMLLFLLKNDFVIVDLEHGKRYDGMDIVRLKKSGQSYLMCAT
jgi:RimJ/RimL family protein N-acetyltransferase